jgi:hypothetical protein
MRLPRTLWLLVCIIGVALAVLFAVLPVGVRFDDDPPYGLRPEEAETLWRGLRQEAAAVACARVPMRQ